VAAPLAIVGGCHGADQLGRSRELQCGREKHRHQGRLARRAAGRRGAPSHGSLPVGNDDVIGPSYGNDSGRLDSLLAAGAKVQSTHTACLLTAAMQLYLHGQQDINVPQQKNSERQVSAAVEGLVAREDLKHASCHPYAQHHGSTALRQRPRARRRGLTAR
jgi:hypothetical protein